MKEAAYKVMVHPILEYGGSVWDPYTDRLQEELKKGSKSCGKVCDQKNVYETGSMTGILGQLIWESLKKRRKDNKLILFIYKGLRW